MKKQLRKFFGRIIFMIVLSATFLNTEQVKADCDIFAHFANGGYYEWLPAPTLPWQTKSNYLAVGECQYYVINGYANRQYAFKTGCGDGAYADYSFDTYLTIYDNYGNLVSADDDNCYDPSNPLKSIVTYTPSIDGIYIIKVSSYGNASGGNYTLAFNEVIPCLALASFTHAINGATVDFTDASVGSPTSYTWDFGDGNTSNIASPSNTYTCSGFYNVILTISEAGGCTNQISNVVYVDVPGGSQAAFSTVSNGNIVSFTDLSTGTIPTHLWDFGDGTTSTAVSPVKTYTCSGGYVITLTTTDINGCNSVSYGYANAEGDPHPDFTIRSVTGLEVTLDDASSGVGLTYAYNFGDGTPDQTDQNPTHTYSCPGTYLISLTVNSNGPCTSNPTYRYVTVTGTPTASFIFTTSGQTATFYNSSVGGVSFAWDFGDGNTSTAIGTTTNTYTCPGKYFVNLTTTSASGCQTSIGHQVTVTGDPSPDFTSSISGTTVDFTSTSTGTSLSYFWNFGDGQTSTVANPQVIYACGGEKVVTLQTTNLAGCVVSTTKVIQIAGDPNPSFITSVTGSTANFTYSGTGNASTWAWDFGDGTSSNTAGSFAHQYNCPGTYNVSLTITGTNGCVVPFSDEVTITGTPVADFNYSSAGNEITFTDASTGSGLTYLWQFGDGSNSASQNPTPHIYQCGGTYEVSLTTTDGTCSATTRKTVEVVSDPYASFSIDVQGVTLNLDNTSLGAITNNFWVVRTLDYSQFQYSFATDPSFTIIPCEELIVYLEISNALGCYDNVFDTISLPYAGIAPTNNADSSLTALASGADNYEWIDCTTGTLVSGSNSQTFIAPIDGSYAVIVTNGACSDTSECLTVDRLFVGLNNEINESNVSIYPNPSANNFLLQSEAYGKINIEITDMIGRTVYTKNVTVNGNFIHHINLSDETSGVYLLKLQSENGNIISKKIVKN